MSQPSRLPRLPASLVLLLAVALGLWVRDIAKAIGTPIPALPMPFGGSLLDNLLATAIALLTAALLLAPGNSLARSLGLQWNGPRGPLLVLLATVPCWIGLWWLGALATDIDLLALLMLALVFPLAEEILFRGLGFVFAQRVLGWPWWLAASVQAVLFGAVHWLGVGGPEGGAMDALVFAVTGIGGFIFALLNRLDGYTLWSGLALHVSLNLAWNVITVADAIAMGWQGIGLRLGAAALAVLLCWQLPARARRPVPL
ncbi:CPBP family intramembrane glutamic endopeptidase [Stenotrophomonas sp. SORGH_AS_0321]|uniref:CPBP family intramembrane glutamic endopeptidase n=1 Tax=Stenotrophomonas sp. SORGH_AS_0321 TaxID=3041787 RepID=UPI00286B898C|nr:CPBP family intramembrane glutamic endopeptidase [Stenotrophomonas sp. SORGH_AS_0321]